MNNEITIPNFTIFEAGMCQVVLHRMTTEDEEDLFQSSLLLWLDDGTSEELEKNVTVFCQLYHQDKMQLAKITFLYASTLFAACNPIVVVVGNDGETEDDIDLSLEKLQPEGARIH